METIKGVRFVDKEELSDVVVAEHLEKMEFDGVPFRRISKWNFFRRRVSRDDLKGKIARYARKVGASVVRMDKYLYATNYGLLITQSRVAAEFYRCSIP